MAGPGVSAPWLDQSRPDLGGGVGGDRSLSHFVRSEGGNPCTDRSSLSSSWCCRPPRPLPSPKAWVRRHSVPIPGRVALSSSRSGSNTAAARAKAPAAPTSRARTPRSIAGPAATKAASGRWKSCCGATAILCRRWAASDDREGGEQAMSKHVPDTAAANAALDTAREPSRRDHLPYQVRHLDEIDWETIRWPGETDKMLFHPAPEQPTAPNSGMLLLYSSSHHPH